MHVREHRMKQEHGHGWCVRHYGITFYPTFASRFDGLRRRYMTHGVFYDEWHKLEDFNTYRGNHPWKGIDAWRSLRGLWLEEGGEEVISWLRENVTGRTHLYCRFESNTDMLYSYDTQVQKHASVAFREAADAVKFKLIFN